MISKALFLAVALDASGCSRPPSFEQICRHARGEELAAVEARLRGAGGNRMIDEPTRKRWDTLGFRSIDSCDLLVDANGRVVSAEFGQRD